MKNNLIFIANAVYSYIWIAAHFSNKFEYREKSRVHDWLVSKYVF